MKLYFFYIPKALIEMTLLLQASRNNPLQDHIRKSHPSSIIKIIQGRTINLLLNQDFARNDPPVSIIKTI